MSGRGGQKGSEDWLEAKESQEKANKVTTMLREIARLQEEIADEIADEKARLQKEEEKRERKRRREENESKNYDEFLKRVCGRHH
tara:strand:- start:34928 stop:35182 length:255 start_codon:yes stop_codon:yes gene_type:complete